MRRFLAVLLFVLGPAALAGAQPTVFLVRHAERAATAPGSPMMADDPDLSGAGIARAEALAKLLKDAKIRAIFTTDLKRTRQTAAPLARDTAVAATALPAKDVAGLVQRIKTATGNVLVVGHSNTLPEIITALGIPDPVTIHDTEFDNLFIVSHGTLIRLHY